MGEVDPAFIQDVEHRPKVTITEAEGIPVIDLSTLNSPDISAEKKCKELASVVAEVKNACKKWGFFQVINHGMSLECREKIDLASRKFFALSKEEKRKVKRGELNPMGYYDTELTKNVRDWKEVFDFIVENPTTITLSHEPDDKELKELHNQWPEYPPKLRLFIPLSLVNHIAFVVDSKGAPRFIYNWLIREVCEEYVQEMQKLSYKLLELISLSLGLPAKRMNGFFKYQTSFVRLNHYPPCPIPHLALGVGRHKDAGGLTILAQDDIGGLEVKRKTDGQWIRVKPTPDAYIINVGDTIQVWGNDEYESVEHRVVVNSERERFSIPFFFNPSHYTWIEPLEELVDEKNPAKYKAYNWGMLFTHRMNSNFKKRDDDNLQIHHFKA